MAACTEYAVNPKRVGLCTTYLNKLSRSAGMKCTPAALRSAHLPEKYDCEVAYAAEFEFVMLPPGPA